MTLGSVAMGAKIIERHITLDKNMEGPDHAASLNTSEFRDLVTGIREIELSMSVESDRVMSLGEN